MRSVLFPIADGHVFGLASRVGPALVLDLAARAPTCSCTAGVFHILFNMLALWMFGAELERMWGTRYFLKFYFVTGIGAGVLTVLFSLLPFGFAQQLQDSDDHRRLRRDLRTAARLRDLFPGSSDLHVARVPVPARYFVMIMGAIAFLRRRSAKPAASPTRRISAACSSATCT